MKTSLVVLAAALVLALLMVLHDPGRAARLSAPQNAAVTEAQQAPAAANDDAAVGELVLERCGGCHSLQTLQQHPQDEAGWTQTVARMGQMGAAVAPSEEPAIVRYLARHFGK